MFEWNDETRAQAVEMYKSREPTPENSTEIDKEIADELGTSPNGVRMILSRAEVYIKKTPGSGSESKTKSSGGTTRVSKEESQSRLTAAIEKLGKEADSDIVSKLTGKAAAYFAEVLESAGSEDE